MVSKMISSVKHILADMAQPARLIETPVEDNDTKQKEKQKSYKNHRAPYLRHTHLSEDIIKLIQPESKQLEKDGECQHPYIIKPTVTNEKKLINKKKIEDGKITRRS